MDFEFYRNFITVAETGNLSGAAARLALAQPALSSQIKTLEKHYGVKLIETARGKRTLTLTEAGTDFLTKARQICEQEDAILLNMQNYRQQARGTLRFAVSYGIVQVFMNKYLQPFARAYPDINFHLHEITTDEQMQAVRNGNADFGFANAPMPEMENLTTRQISLEKFYIIYSRNNNLNFAPKKAVRLSQLKGLPISTNYGSLNLLKELCARYQFTPKIHFLSNNGRVAIQFAENGRCLAIASDDCCQNLPENLQRMLISDKNFHFQQTLFWSSIHRQTVAAKLFLKFIGK